MLNFPDTQQWCALAIVFYLGVLGLLAAYVFAVRRSSIFEPVSLFLFFVSLFALPLPARYVFTKVVEGDVSPYLEQFAAFMPAALGLTALALMVFVAAYYCPLARRVGDGIPLLRDRGVQGTGAGILVLILLSVVLIYLLTVSLGGIVAFLLLGYRSSEETFGRGYLAVGFPWLVVAMVALFERYAAGRRWLDLSLGVLLLVANVVMFAMTGNRSMIMYLAISLIVFFNFRIRKISLKVLIPIAVAGFAALNLMGTLRGSDYRDVDEFVDKTFSPDAPESSTNKENFFYTLTIGEFVVPFETLPQMMRTIGISEMPWLGASFARAPVYLVPSFIYPDRPTALGSWYMEEYYGGGYGLNEGRAFFFLAEGYLNFGPFGVLLLAGLWGIAWGALHRWMLRGRERFGTVLIYALLVAFMFRCIAGDFATLLVGTTQQSMAGVVVILLVASLVGGRRLPVQRVARS